MYVIFKNILNSKKCKRQLLKIVIKDVPVWTCKTEKTVRWIKMQPLPLLGGGALSTHYIVYPRGVWTRDNCNTKLASGLLCGFDNLPCNIKSPSRFRKTSLIVGFFLMGTPIRTGCARTKEGGSASGLTPRVWICGDIFVERWLSSFKEGNDLAICCEDFTGCAGKSLFFKRLRMSANLRASSI